MRVPRGLRGTLLTGSALLVVVSQAVSAQTRLRVEFTSDRGCVVSTSGTAGRASVKYPRRTPDRRCAVPALSRAPGSEGVEIEAILPAGEPRPVDEFPRMDAWALRDEHWVGTARVDGLPAFVRVPPATSFRQWRVRALDGGVLLAVALGIAWSIVRGRAA